MSSALDTLRSRIQKATPEQAPEGLVCVISPGGRDKIRLVVDRESGRAVASDGKQEQVNVHRDPAIAAMRALSAVLTGG